MIELRKSEVLEIAKFELDQELRVRAELIGQASIERLSKTMDIEQAKRIVSESCYEMTNMVQNILDRFETAVKDSFFDSTGDILRQTNITDKEKVKLISEMFEVLEDGLKNRPELELPNELKNIVNGGD